MREKAHQEIATPAFVDKPKSELSIVNTTRFSTKKLAYLATFTALSLLMKIFGNNISLMFGGTLRLSLVYIPWFLTAIIFGAFPASLVVFATDALGTLITPNSFINIGVMFGNIVSVIIIALVFKLVKIPPTVRIIIGMTLTTFVCTLGINTLALSIMSNTAFLQLFVLRLQQIPVIAINAVIIVLLYPLLKKSKLLDLLKSCDKA